MHGKNKSRSSPPLPQQQGLFPVELRELSNFDQYGGIVTTVTRR